VGYQQQTWQGGCSFCFTAAAAAAQHIYGLYMISTSVFDQLALLLLLLSVCQHAALRLLLPLLLLLLVVLLQTKLVLERGICRLAFYCKLTYDTAAAAAAAAAGEVGAGVRRVHSSLVLQATV
jgi:hypothetical protein